MKTNSAFGGAFIQDFVIYNVVSGNASRTKLGVLLKRRDIYLLHQIVLSEVITKQEINRWNNKEWRTKKKLCWLFDIIIENPLIFWWQSDIRFAANSFKIKYVAKKKRKEKTKDSLPPPKEQNYFVFDVKRGIIRISTKFTQSENRIGHGRIDTIKDF